MSRIEKSKKRKSRSDLLNILIFASIFCDVSCGSSSPNQLGDNKAAEFAQQANIFSGVTTVDRQPGNLSIIRWDPIDTPDAVYSLFKSTDKDSINFDSPFTTAQGNNFTYKPLDQYSERSLCFGVRVSNFGRDVNRKTICSEQPGIGFEGLKNLKRLGNGAYVLEWDAIPVDNVVYTVFDRQNGEQFNFEQPSYDAIKNNFFSVPTQVERGNKFCYIVRYRHPDLTPDKNSKELCTDLEQAIIFDGVKDLTALGGGKIKATWDKSTTSDVKSYHIYQGSDFREVIATVDNSAQDVTIQGLVQGRQYNIGVRAVDTYGREDRNIRIRAIVIPQDSVP